MLECTSTPFRNSRFEEAAGLMGPEGEGKPSQAGIQGQDTVRRKSLPEK